MTKKTKTADAKTSPDGGEQASAADKPVKPKRATRRKTPETAQRADDAEAPVSDERVDVTEAPEQVVRTIEQSRLALKRKVRMMYDLQRLRMQAGGRTLKRPTKPDSEERVEIFLHEVDLAILETRTTELRKVEKSALRDVEDHLKTLSFYNDVLSDKIRYRGIGPTMAGVIMSEFDIRRADTVSKMWSFSGLISKPAFRCRKCYTLTTEDTDGTERRAQLELERQAAVVEVMHARSFLTGQLGDEHQIAKRKDELDRAIGKAMRLKNEVERIPMGAFVHRPKAPKGCTDPLGPADVIASGEAQRPTKGVKLPYNSFLRVKLVGVLGPVLIKSGSPWRKVYDDYKLRLQSKGWGKNDGHRHQASIRYMVKMLLMDIHKRWREHEGLPVREPYSVEKLGMAPHSSDVVPSARPQRAPRAEFDDDHAPDEVPYEQDVAAELEYLEAAE